MIENERVIVGNVGSYYHEGYWSGCKIKKFTQDLSKAKRFGGKVPSKEDLDEYDYVRENFSHAHPIFVRVANL